MYISENESAPQNLGLVDTSCDQMMIYMYLPIKMADSEQIFLPERLCWIKPILDRINPSDYKGRYVYVTAKHTYVSPQSMTQRMGWHIDGYGTDDLNFLWYSEVPTEFCLGDYDLPESDSESIKAMEAQVKGRPITTYPIKNLLRLCAKEVHRVSESHSYEGMRTFVKISISKNRFNLIGNSKNYLINYDWAMVSRSKTRNMENNKDFV